MQSNKNNAIENRLEENRLKIDANGNHNDWMWKRKKETCEQKREGENEVEGIFILKQREKRINKF